MTGGMEQGSSTLGQSGKAVPAGRHIGAAWAGISATTLLVVLPLLIGALFLVASAVIGIGATVLRNREGLDPSAYEVGFAVASFLIVGLVVLVVREVFGVLVDLGARAKAGPTKSVRGDWVRVRRPIGIFAALIIASNLALASLEHPTRLGLGGFQVAPVLVAMGLFIALALGVASMVMVAGVRLGAAQARRSAFRSGVLAGVGLLLPAFIVPGYAAAFVALVVASLGRPGPEFRAWDGLRQRVTRVPVLGRRS